MVDLPSVALGAGLTGVVSYVTMYLQSRLQSDRDKTTHERQFYAKELDELRAAYGAVLLSADAYETARNSSAVVFGESPEQRAERIREMLVERNKAMQKPIERLIVEPDAQPALQAYNAVVRAYLAFSMALSMGGPAVLQTSEEMDAALSRLRTLPQEQVNRLKERALR